MSIIYRGHNVTIHLINHSQITVTYANRIAKLHKFKILIKSQYHKNVLDQDKIRDICSYRAFFDVIQFRDNWPRGSLKNKIPRLVLIL